jgi:hypothetical protein
MDHQSWTCFPRSDLSRTRSTRTYFLIEWLLCYAVDSSRHSRSTPAGSRTVRYDWMSLRLYPDRRPFPSSPCNTNIGLDHECVAFWANLQRGSAVVRTIARIRLKLLAFSENQQLELIFLLTCLEIRMYSSGGRYWVTPRIEHHRKSLAVYI